MTYEHKQRAPLWLILLPVGILLLSASWRIRAGGDHAAAVILLVAAVMMILLAMSFTFLLVRDEGDHLSVGFGPLPLFRRHVPYAKVTAVEPARSSFIDGWGIHYTPGRGWIWNLWGRDCVRVRMGKKVLRIGSDDAGELARFLSQKIAARSIDTPLSDP